jgi:hypothetical protein
MGYGAFDVVWPQPKAKEKKNILYDSYEKHHERKPTEYKSTIENRNYKNIENRKLNT